MECCALGMVFIVFASISCVHAECQQPFFNYNNNCYYFGTNSITNFEQAFKSCQSIGEYLLNIDAQPEMDFIADTIRKHQLRFDGYWTGGYFNGQNWEWQRLATDESGVYVSIPIRGYFNWAVRKPNNFYAGRSERFLAILLNAAPEPFKWYSENYFNALRMSYICERDWKE